MATPRRRRPVRPRVRVRRRLPTDREDGRETPDPETKTSGESRETDCETRAACCAREAGCRIPRRAASAAPAETAHGCQWPHVCRGREVDLSRVEKPSASALARPPRSDDATGDADVVCRLHFVQPPSTVASRRELSPGRQKLRVR